MNRKQTRTSLAIFGIAVLVVMMTTSKSNIPSALALGHLNKPDGLGNLLGLPFGDTEQLLNKGRGTFLDSDGGALNQFPSEAKVDNTASGDGTNPNLTPSNEMISTNTPEKDGTTGGESGPTDDESVAEVSDKSDGNIRENKYEEFQGCLAIAVREGSPTEQQVRECSESSYGDGSESTPKDNTDKNEGDEKGVTEHVSTDDAEDEDNEDEDEDIKG